MHHIRPALLILQRYGEQIISFLFLADISFCTAYYHMLIHTHTRTHFSIILFNHISSRSQSLKSLTALLWTTSIWSIIYLKQCPKQQQIVLLRPSWWLQEHYSSCLYPNPSLETFARAHQFLLASDLWSTRTIILFSTKLLFCLCSPMHFVNLVCHFLSVWWHLQM